MMRFETPIAQVIALFAVAWAPTSVVIDRLAVGYQVVSIIGGILGIAFLLWNWHRKNKEAKREDIKWEEFKSDRRDRRERD